MKEEIKSEVKFKDELSRKVAEIEKSAQFVLNKYDEGNPAANAAWKLQRSYRKKTSSLEHKSKN